jgi:undecaprenyl diphosphate synthase
MTASPDPTTDPVSAHGPMFNDRESPALHVAIIMDGNGRWAKSRGLPRTEGHRRGLDVVRRIVRRANAHHIGYLTLFSFSSENWRRPPDEVSFLLGLLKLFIRRDLADLHASNVRVRVIGERNDLPDDIRALLQDAEALTIGNKGLTLVVAFNYGARQEILHATRRIATEVAAGRLRPEDITEADIVCRLYAGDIPDPDLIIRTSGEQRLSNFLLWQSAYAEFVFVPTLWPDFDEAAFDHALSQFQARERRFGGVVHGASL